ncbi:MAG: hypothetical protein AB1801_08165 [Chloroflexota bacterium]
MKKIRLTIGLLTILISLLGFVRVVQAQGGGCPADPPPVSANQYQVVTALPLLSQAVPETSSSELVEARKSFLSDRFPGFSSASTTASSSLRIPLNYIANPNWRVILSSTPDGNGPTCTDDIVRVETSAGLVFEHDFRSPDRSRIVSLEPVDVTALLTESDELWIELSLIDLTGPRFSSSPYYLVIVETSSGVLLPPPAHIYKPLPPQAASTFTPTPPTTATPTVIPTSTSPPPTPLAATARSTPLAASPASTPTPGHSAWPLPVPPRMVSGLVLLVVATLFIQVISRRPKLPGVLEIAKDGEPWKTVDLSAYGPTVTIGRKGRIELEDDEDHPTLPALVARLRAERDPDGSVRLIWQPVEEDGQWEAGSYQLTHGGEEVIGPYRLVYQNFSQTETPEDLLAGGIWNEI